MATVILTGGGSAGHCTPNLALIPYLKEYFNQIIYIGSKNGIEKKIIEKTNIRYFGISTAKLNRKQITSNLSIPFSVLKGIKEAGRILDRYSPNVIFSKGGYVALPVVFAAKKRKIPIISHESDLTVGLANKIISRYSKKVLTSFPQTAKTIKNGEFSGSPLRNELFNADKENALKYFGFDGKKPILLITGGSQGARAINSAIYKILDRLLTTFDIIHICGKGNLNNQINKPNYYQTEYLNNIQLAFSVTSVAVTRAGSNTIFELLALNIPCVLIPLPKGQSRGDQVLNAEYFHSLGVATLLYQHLITPSSLYITIFSTYLNRDNIKYNLKLNPVKNASKKIADIIIDYSK